jgi:RHS repeat-associated protein
MRKIIAFFLLLCFNNSFAQVNLTDFTSAQNYYSGNFAKNLQFVNKIFNTNYSNYANQNPGNINGEYLQSYAGLNGCSGTCAGACEHKGIDYRAVSGTAIYSLIAGVVLTNASDTYGTIAVYNSDKNLTLLYLHCSSVIIPINGIVAKGQLLGYSGAQGAVAHLHLELRNGMRTNASCLETAPATAQTYDPRLIDDIFAPVVSLIAPTNNAQLNAENINFTWNALPNATAYRIQISTTQTFATTVVNENVGNVSNKIYSLQPNTEYFWRVKSNLTAVFDANDEVRRLLAIPAAPNLIYPTSGASNMPTTVNFDWDDTQGALNYRIQVSDNPNLLLEQFSGPYLLDYPSTGTFTQSNYTWAGALVNKNYYWRVRVNTAKGTSLYAARSFATGAITTGGGASFTMQLYYSFNNLAEQSLPLDNNADIFLPTQNLLPGYHTAYFYSKKNTGSRSGITKNNFVKVLGNASSNAMEYWFDSSFASRQSLPFTNAAAIDLNVPTNVISIGYHLLHYRFQLQGGLWSSVHSSSFIKNTNNNTNGSIMEYWFDNVFENRQTQTITNSSNIDFNLGTDDLDLGAHTVYYRFKIGTDIWSSVSSSTFNKLTTQSSAILMEHWFNGDFDNRISIPVTDLTNVDVNTNTNGLPTGINTLYTRFQKGNGYWSSITSNQFLKNETGSNGWQYQYWVDSTLGFATTLPIVNPASIDLYADVNNVDTGWHIIYSRFRRNNGMWSSLVADSFYKNTSTFQCTVNNSPSGEDSIATHFLCKYQIILNPQDGIVNLAKLKRKDLAKITYRALVGTATIEPVTLANYLPSLFGDLQSENTSNSYYFNAAKFLSYIDYGDGIPPFNPSRLNFHPEDTIVRGYALKVLLEAWNIKPDATLPNPYADLVPDAEVNGYILKAAQMGLIKTGGIFTNFRPFQAVTRIEAFVMLYRLLQLSSKPNFIDDDFHIPFNRNEFVGNNPSIGEGNFSSYGETPFTIKGVPSLSFSFNYNAASTEVPDEGVRGKNANGNLIYDQQNIGVGWNHNYNNYVLVDTGITTSNTDDRYLIMWSSGNVQVYNPNTNAYTTKGVYDILTKDAFNPALITIKTKSQVSYRFEKLAGVSGNILHLVSVKDRHNNTVSLSYENGYSTTAGIIIKRLKEVDDGHTRKIAFAYIANSNLIDSVSANAGNLHKGVSFDYIVRRLTKYTNPKKDFSIYNYSALPGQEYLITKIVMPKGNIITNKYNKGNKLSSTQLNSTQQTLIETNAIHTATNNSTDIKIKTILNGVTQQQNIKNNQYSMPIAAAGPNYKTGIEYTDVANVLLPTKVKDSLTNVEVTPVYSSNGNLLSITKSGGAINITETMQYNGNNDITQKVDGNGNTTNFMYNTLGQLKQINAPENVTTLIYPNANGTVDSISNPSSIGTKFMYDAYGNVIQTKMPLGIVSQAQNDAYGRLLKSITPKNVSTDYLYDANDNMMQESFDTTGLNIITQYRFDKNDNLIEVENAKGNITYLTYNENDQLIKEQFGTAIKKYAYSDDGRLKKFTNPNGINFLNTFNEKDLLVNDGYATYNYYADNSLQSINKNNKAITYSYDALKRITSVYYNDFGNNTVNYEYDNNSNITKIIYPNSIAVLYEYDANNRLIKVKDAANLAWATYAYLLDGRLNTQTNRNGTIVKYFYDAAARMDSMVTTKADGTIIAAYGFKLDKLGNHEKESFNQPFMQTPPALGDSTGYTYNNMNRLLTKNAENYSYNNNGNLTGITKAGAATNYVYDTKNNLVQYNENGNAITYEYDGLGQRRMRNNTRYVLDNAYNVLVETDASGVPQYYYIHGLGMIARVKVSNSQPYFYHHDFRGSTVAITNSNQAITHRYQYGAFGETQQVQEEDFNAYRYVGKYGVGYETKDLTFMRARYYRPSIGRFNSEDPVWASNLYPYGDNNPVLNIDPNGKWASATGSKGFLDQHADIFREALLKNVTSDQLIQLINGSNYVDESQFQSKELSFMHAMVSSEKNKRKDIERYNNYLKILVESFVKGDDEAKAYFQLGKALHAISDKYSPEHGFKVWNPNDLIGHATNETIDYYSFDKSMMNEEIQHFVWAAKLKRTLYQRSLKK